MAIDFGVFDAIFMVDEGTVSKPKQHRSCHFKGTKGGEWKHGAELIADMVMGNKTLQDDDLQKELFDWILTDEKNMFRNKQTQELVFALAAKRGNVAYAAKKGEKLNCILDSVANNEFDHPVDGLRSSKFRHTKILLVTLTFSHQRYTAEEAWALLRSTPLEDIDFECGALNKFGANISSIFGSNGKLTCKEADSKGYPAPHVIIVLDRPVIVKKHNDKDGTVSWRLANDHILRRVGKDEISRRMSREDVERATRNNPIWTHGLMDIKGIIKQDRFGKFSNGFTYVFKYLIKTVSFDRYPELKDLARISDSGNKSLRTMMYTHLGNKCFRTRDIVFGKAFKDRIGLSSNTEPKSEIQWERVKTIPAWLADKIQEIKSRNYSVSYPP